MTFIDSVDKCIDLVKKLYLGNPIHYESVEAMAASDNIDAIWINAPNNHRVAILEKIVKGIRFTTKHLAESRSNPL